MIIGKKISVSLPSAAHRAIPYHLIPGLQMSIDLSKTGYQTYLTGGVNPNSFVPDSIFNPSSSMPGLGMYGVPHGTTTGGFKNNGSRLRWNNNFGGVYYREAHGGASPLLLKTRDMTVAVRFRVTGTTTHNSIFGSNMGDSRRYYLPVSDGTWLYFRLGGNSSSHVAYRWVLNQWVTFIIVVNDHTKNPKGLQVYGPSGFYGQANLDNVGVATASPTIGQFFHHSVASFFDMDAVAVWNRPINEGEIKHVFRTF
jgi:hypothetical protein